MYSPKIDEELIPVLYHTARAKRVPMTVLVTNLIGKALATEEDLPPAVMEAITSFVTRPELHTAV